MARGAILGADMGLLDPMDDPRTMGLLSLGMGLLGSKGSFGNALSQAGPQALQAMRQVKQDKSRQAQMEQAQKLQDLQLRMAQQQMVQQTAQQQRQAEAERLRGGYLNSIDPSAGPAMPFNPASAMRAGLNASEIETLAPQSNKPLIVDGNVLDPVTFKPLWTAPQKPEKDPEAIRTLKLIHGENTPAFAAALAAYGKKMTTHQPGTSVNVGGLFEKEYDKAQGKSFSEVKEGINKTAFAAPSQIRKLERMEQLLDGVDGGKLAPTGLDIASAANSIGIKIDPKLGNKEAAQALAREIAGGFRQPGTGPMTDKDFENFLLQVPDLSKTAAGRKQITATMKAAAARDIQIGKMARDYERRVGKLDDGFLDEAAQFVAENPVVGMPSGWKVR